MILDRRKTAYKRGTYGVFALFYMVSAQNTAITFRNGRHGGQWKGLYKKKAVSFATGAWFYCRTCMLLVCMKLVQNETAVQQNRG